MKRLWAPWRSEYIKAPARGECIFCAAQKIKKDEKSLVVKITSKTVVMLNKYPYNSAHILISPKRHKAEIEDLSDAELADIFSCLKKTTGSIKKAYKAHGFNVGFNIGRAAGAGIEDHIHMHVVPRWQGDVNFMPIIADTKVMPEHMENILETLRRSFD